MSKPIDQIDYLIDEYEEIEWITENEMEYGYDCDYF
jgi:hypothetical protein